MYNFGTNSAIELFDKKIQENIVGIRERLSKQILNAEKLIDLQCKIASFYTGWWSQESLHVLKGTQRLTPLLFSAFHKNIFSLYSALRLSTSGLYGPARPILRNTFEWLMISKFASISEKTKVLEKWNENKTIYFSNSVLKKIKDPDPEPFSTFWSIVCEHSHATRAAMQITLDIDNEGTHLDIAGNVAIVNALIECNYHLLNTHLITSEFEYMGKYYYGRAVYDMPEYKVPEFRKQAHFIFKTNRKFFKKDAVKLIAAYKRKWKLS